MSPNNESNETNDIPIGLYVSSSGDQEYTSIQEAIDAAPENYTVYVFSGVYNETLVINKTIQLIGENPENTIIDAKKIGAVIKIVDADFCNVTGFTIRNAKSNLAGIDIRSGNNNISNNIVRDNTNGINSNGVKYNTYFNNRFISNSNYALYISSESNYNVLKKNIFTNNSCGLRIKGSRFNQVLMNLFQDNERGMYFCCGARNNIVYHNDFINNSLWNGNDYVGGNTWYDEASSQGNYWDDYKGIDADEDGIGDSAYNVTSDGSKQDLYPLMEPVESI
jgi:parallel beta-helix repeat protein